MKWNLEWLRTFKAIYETGTLTAAAQELFISQPGVSLHLNSLEAYTGYKLFERASKKMTPTEKGKYSIISLSPRWRNWKGAKSISTNVRNRSGTPSA